MRQYHLNTSNLPTYFEHVQKYPGVGEVDEAHNGCGPSFVHLLGHAKRRVYHPFKKRTSHKMGKRKCAFAQKRWWEILLRPMPMDPVLPGGSFFSFSSKASLKQFLFLFLFSPCSRAQRNTTPPMRRDDRQSRWLCNPRLLSASAKGTMMIGLY